MTPTEILKRPYHRIIVPDEDGIVGEILEFPGCIAVGDSVVECAANLESLAEDWVAATIELGQEVPEPVTDACHKARHLFGISFKAKRAAGAV